MEDFVNAKFYCPHALADGNQRIRIRKKTLEFCLEKKTIFYFIYLINQSINQSCIFRVVQVKK